MEPEVIALETALKAVAILSTIPVVLYALWADYYGRYLQRLKAEGAKSDQSRGNVHADPINPPFNPEEEVEKVRSTSLFVILFQLTLFLGSTEVRQEYP